LEARFFGNLTQVELEANTYPPSKVSGVLHLHRDTVPTIRSATPASPGSCDPSVHDRLATAQWRSPSDCEEKFDSSVRAALAKAFQPVVDSFSAKGWMVEKRSRPGPITGQARRMEKNLYRIDFTDAGAFGFELALSPSNPEFQRLQKNMMDATQEMAEQMKSGKPPSMDELQRVAREMQGASRIVIAAVINFDSIENVNFKGDYTRSGIPGESSGFALYIPYAQSPGGGGIDGAGEMMSVHLGHWGPPAATKASDGSENVRVPAALNKSAPLLSVENLRIRIEANQTLQQQILRKIDFSALRPLLPR
ncbi:MAG TPA: hypothetical protein VKS01_11440, partial [Bryobacteraceae bacterium]|nr:hypothetical protein [Bryobacteraceae bacterium]